MLFYKMWIQDDLFLNWNLFSCNWLVSQSYWEEKETFEYVENERDNAKQDFQQLMFMTCELSIVGWIISKYMSVLFSCIYSEEKKWCQLTDTRTGRIWILQCYKGYDMFALTGNHSFGCFQCYYLNMHSPPPLMLFQ